MIFQSLNQPLKRKWGIFLQLPVRTSRHQRLVALISLDRQHSHRHCAALHSSLAQLAPKPEHMTEVVILTAKPCPCYHTYTYSYVPESYSTLCWADSVCASFPLVVSGTEEDLSFMGKHRKVTEGLTPLGLLPSCNLGFSPR